LHVFPADFSSLKSCGNFLSLPSGIMKPGERKQ
jgi:hypothetical protein